MNARVLFPLLAVLGAGALVAVLLFGDGLAGGFEAGGEHDAAYADTGGGLERGDVALDSSGTGPRRPRAPVEPGAEETGPKKPTFPAAEGVSGRVVDARRRPIADAKVTLHPFPLEAQWWGAPDAEAVADTKTGKDGTFLVGPAPEGRIKVRAVAPGFAPNVQPLPQRGSRIEIVLDQGGALDVKVVDGKGAPVADAGVVHTAGTWQAQVVTSATTDKDGVARFDALPTGTGQLLVSKPGLGAVRQNDVGVTLGKNDLTVVLQGGRELTGVVTNLEDKRPLAGVTIDISYPYVPSIKPPPTVTTNDEGRYRTVIDVGQHEQFELRAVRTGFAEARLWLNYNDSGNGSMQHSFTLGQAGAGVTGRVLGPDGGGVAGATVTYANQRPGMKFPSVATDGDGRFDLPAPPGGTPGSWQMVLAISANDGVAIAQTTLPQKNESRGKAVEIRLAGSGNVTGTVKDGSGQPAEGAAVSVVMDWEAMQRKQQAAGRGMDWTAMQALQDPKVSSRLTAVSDAQGTFQIRGVPAGMYQLTALWAGLQATHPEALDVSARAPAHADLVLGEGLTIEGYVVDGEDRPVQGANVWAHPTQQRQGMVQTYPNARSQSDGRFELRNVGAASTYVVSGQAAGYGNDQAKDVAPGTRDVKIRLRALGWIEGQVLVNGQPLVGIFTVSASKKSDGRGGSEEENEISWRGGGMWGGGGRSQLYSAADGRFVLRGLASGEYAVSATTPDGLVVVDPPAVSVTDGRGSGPLTLGMLRGSVLKGEVEGVDGKPVANAWLWVSPVKAEEGRNAPSGNSRTDEKGAFLVRGLGSGAYNVNVGGSNVVPWTERVDLQVGEEKQIRLVERPPGRVRVTVVDDKGNPLAKAQPNVMDANGNDHGPNWQLLVRDGLLDPKQPNAWERISQTDGSGVLVRHHVAPGRYQVSAWLDGFTPPKELPWIDVASNALTEVTVTLTAGSPRR